MRGETERTREEAKGDENQAANVKPLKRTSLREELFTFEPLLLSRRYLFLIAVASSSLSLSCRRRHLVANNAPNARKHSPRFAALTPTAGDDEHRRDAASCDYLCGRNVLICPVYVKGATGRGVDLPNSDYGDRVRWYDLRAGTWHDGGDVVWVDCGLDDMTPTFVLGGTAVCRIGEGGEGVRVDAYLCEAHGDAEGEGHYEGVGWVHYRRRAGEVTVKAERECEVEVREFVRGEGGEVRTFKVTASVF